MFTENNFKIRLEMLSDWQIGMGAGIPGGVDELVSKDWQEFPQVPAKTIVGIWRDALEQLALGLNKAGIPGNWEDCVEIIFGNQPAKLGANPTITPIPAKLHLLSARIEPALRAKIAADKKFKQALTFVKVGVKIDEVSETASDDMLHFDEMGRVGTVLEAEVELEKTNETISSLLILSAKLAERMGGKRRRGAGKCRLTIEGVTGKDELEAKNWLENKRTDSDKFKKVEKALITQTSSDWQTCEYTLTLETPVSIVTAVLGNVSETLDFIPGTHLISHFVDRCGQDFFEALRNNNIQISPATVSIDGSRGLPVPKVFAQEKMDKTKTYNRLINRFDENTPQTKPIREGFAVLKDKKTILYQTSPQTLLMHNTIKDELQRPTSDIGGVYSREAIQAGTVLKGEIRFRNSTFDDIKKFDGRIRLGTSKKDDYGWARLKLEAPKEFQTRSSLMPDSNQLIVYLASDTLLSDQNLRQTNLVKDLKTELEKTLGQDTLKSYDELLDEARQEFKNAGEKLKNNPNDEEAKKILENAKTFIQDRKGLINSIVHVRRLESWQSRWGLPRPTLTPMQAGSVVVFEIQNFEAFTDQNKADFELKLKEIEKNGIGERRGEGYGQIIFNPKILEVEKPDWQKGKLTKPEDSNDDGEIKDKKFAKLIEEIAWREELKIAVSKIAAQPGEREKIFGFKGLNMSQIGGLRSVIARLKSETETEKRETKKIVTDWIDHLEKTKNRRDKWGNERIRKIKELINDEIKVWLILCESKIDDINVWQTPAALVQTPEALRKKFWAEAIKSLFYACQMAHKREIEKKRSKEADNGAGD